jgi:site-specific recombinase XerD
MNKSNILLVVSSSRKRKGGKAPLYCRITYLKFRKQFATGLFVNPKYWNSKKQKVLDKTEQSDYQNKQLSLIISKINQAFLLLQIQETSFDVNDIYRQYKGEKLEKDYTILEAYDKHNEMMKKLVEIDLNRVSWSRYIESKRKVKAFIKATYKRPDVKLKSLDIKFIMGLEYYMKTELKLSQATINKSLQRVGKVIKFSIAQNHISTDSFLLFKPKKFRQEVVFLNSEELAILEKHHFSQLRLQQVCDMFIFCCYTGLAYTEMSNLRKSHIATGFDGQEWIKMKRQKTHKMIAIPLLSKAKAVLCKYDGYSADKLLPVISNQKFNSYLKEIADIVGVGKKLTHHTARKTFASTILLFNDVPMEIVSELLGHSSMAITQEHYGKVVKKKVSEQMKRLNGSISSS